jgi:uroporphyrin-III C-methyltransferase/precorrin-2 dehydrogenase/sirohydrochlorin ferrochelatase
VIYQPVFLALEGRAVVIVGGGHLAALKAAELIEAGAAVTVVSEAPDAAIRAHAAAGRLVLLERGYRDGDLASAWLAFAAAGDPALHARVKAEADRSRIWLNAVDDVPNCSFIAGSVHRQGDVVVAVTTSGACPALAVRLRQTIGRLVGPEHGRFAAIAARLRRRVARRIKSFESRKRFWYSLVDSPAIETIRRGRERDARRLAHRLLARAAREERVDHAGRVILVGAGPGHPGLITVQGATWLRAADVVVHDRLVSPELLREARADARLIDVGKDPAGRCTPQERIHEILLEEARAGRLVVRLKGGDPFVFGRGAEEADALREAGIDCVVIPGISSAIAGPGAAGIPVTRRQVSGAFAVVTGHEALGAPPLDWTALAAVPTLVVLMGRERLAAIVARLVAAGQSPDTPAALVSNATLESQRSVRGRLADLAALADEGGIVAPATLVIGAVVELDAAPAAVTRHAPLPAVQQRHGVPPGGLPVRIPEHPRELGHPVFAVDHQHVARRDPGFRPLRDDEMAVRPRGDGRQVGDHEYLVPLADVGEGLGELGAHFAAHALVDLVEHERRNPVLPRQGQR